MDTPPSSFRHLFKFKERPARNLLAIIGVGRRARIAATTA
jgi:hypothetical protein